MRRRARSSMCSMATVHRSTRSHFRLMVCASSLAQGTNQCGRGILKLHLATLESRPKTPPLTSRTLDGSFPQTDKCTSCLSHLMHGCLILPTSLLYLPL